MLLLLDWLVRPLFVKVFLNKLTLNYNNGWWVLNCGGRHCTALRGGEGWFVPWVGCYRISGFLSPTGCFPYLSELTLMCLRIVGRLRNKITKVSQR